MEDVLAYWLGEWGSSNSTILASMVYAIACMMLAWNMTRPEKEV